MVFAVSHLLGFSYAPRFKNFPRQRLYIFKSHKGSDRSAWKIKPAGYADDEIVIEQRNEPVLEAANFTFLRGWAKIAMMQFLMSRLQASSISWSSFSA